MPLSVGETLGPHKILAPIARQAGGTDEVYKAHDTSLDHIFALKASNAKFSERFEREGKAIGALNAVSRRIHESSKFPRNQRCIPAIAAGLSIMPRFGLCDTAPRTQRDDLNPTGIRTAGIRMVPVVNAKYKVWTKKLGSGPIKVLLLHGGPGFSHEYLEAMESFLPQAGIEMYYYDQLGCNNSDQPDDSALWTLPRYVEEVEEVRRGLGLERFVVYGHSWGGILAIDYALKYQSHLRGLAVDFGYVCWHPGLSQENRGVKGSNAPRCLACSIARARSQRRLRQPGVRKNHDGPVVPTDDLPHQAVARTEHSARCGSVARTRKSTSRCGARATIR